MKLVRQHAAPTLRRHGALCKVRDAVKNGSPFEKQKGRCNGELFNRLLFLNAYLAHLRSFMDLGQLSKKRIVINANSGLAGTNCRTVIGGHTDSNM